MSTYVHERGEPYRMDERNWVGGKLGEGTSEITKFATQRQVVVSG